MHFCLKMGHFGDVGQAVDCVILLSQQEHLQEESTRYCLSALGSQIAGGLCVASILVDFRTKKLRATAFNKPSYLSQ
ncbi:hypothetical protein VAWG004_20800 [Aeromonas veronii]|nr:hypothetical protein VAWG004_20800 [Aeromonas veronii]